MKWSESWLIRYVLPSAVVSAWLIRISIDSSLVGLAYSTAGLLTVAGFVAFYLQGRRLLEILYNQEEGFVVIIRPAIVELYSLMLIQSVPIGIDLSESARGILRSMWIRFREETGGELSFVMCRPLGTGPTRLGFMIVRREAGSSAYRLVERLAKKVREDSSILRASMNAAYPHAPVVRGSFGEILTVASGGVSIAEDS
jgi:hypothetical protein